MFHQLPIFTFHCQAGGGSGLGMMIAKGIVDLHGGEIRYTFYSPHSPRLPFNLPHSSLHFHDITHYITCPNTPDHCLP